MDLKDIKTITTRNYGFVKAILKDDVFKFYYYDNELKKLKEINFINKKEQAFHESEFFKKFIKNNSN